MRAGGSGAEIIRALEARRYQAMLTGDTEMLGALLSDALVYTHSNGQRDTKQSLLARIAEGHINYRRIDHPIDQIVISGDCALVVGFMRADVVVSGGERKLDNATLSVWVRSPNLVWRLLGFQPTVLTPG